MWNDKFLILDFPGLDPAKFKITSPKTDEYNCIAWASDENENDRWWWPDQMKQNYWPPGVPRETTVAAFVKAYQTVGYDPCDTGDLEDGFEKIAIYVSATGKPTHAARQLSDGQWTSKLGRGHDITHALDGISGFRARSYGTVAQFLRRKREALTSPST